MAETAKSSRVVRAGSWLHALFGGAFLALTGAIAALYLGWGEVPAAGVGAFLGVAGWVGAFLNYMADCPSCGRRLKFSNVAVEDDAGAPVRGVREGYVFCPGCRGYARHVGETLVELEPEHLADQPVFEVRGGDLGAYSPEVPDPSVCAACGGPAVAAEIYPLLVASEEVALGAMLRMQKAQVELGHCEAHEDAARGDGYVIWLRSYALWRRISRS